MAVGCVMCVMALFGDWGFAGIGFAIIVVGTILIEPKRIPQLVSALRRHFFGLEALSQTPAAMTDTQQIRQDSKVLGATKPGPAADAWYTELRPVLHQASHYSVPTYYLDTDLHLVDWNIAFDLVFTDIIDKVRNQHVNSLIACFDNRGEVIDHAREFTRRYMEEGDLPLVDMEPIRYRSDTFGMVEFLKVACQLHDAAGQLRGWSVALVIREIAWGSFQTALHERLAQDKLWSVYSRPYDRVLAGFPQYQDLIRDIIAAVPPGQRTVLDLGSGTGNVVSALLDAGHRVTAVENNIMMLDRFLSKTLNVERLTIVKGSVEHLQILDDESFDAATMLNVLYAVDDPFACLCNIHRVLKPGGMLSFSTTHSETRLSRLLHSIKTHLENQGRFDELAADYFMLEDINKKIEKDIARKYTRDDYRGWVRDAGFLELRYEPSTYEDAVMLVHARKE